VFEDAGFVVLRLATSFYGPVLFLIQWLCNTKANFQRQKGTTLNKHHPQ